MSAQLLHKRDTEPADLIVALSFGIKVAPTLSSTHIDASERILKRLFEPEELEDGQVDGRVQTQSALVGPESRVELDAITTLDVCFSLVVFPYDAELDHALGDLGGTLGRDG